MPDPCDCQGALGPCPAQHGAKSKRKWMALTSWQSERIQEHQHAKDCRKAGSSKSDGAWGLNLNPHPLLRRNGAPVKLPVSAKVVSCSLVLGTNADSVFQVPPLWCCISGGASQLSATCLGESIRI